MLEEPDTVPIFEIWIDTRVAEAILGRPTYYGGLLSRGWYELTKAYARGRRDEAVQSFIRDQIAVHRKLGLDAICVWLTYPKRVDSVRFLGEGLYEERFGGLSFGLRHRYAPQTENLALVPPYPVRTRKDLQAISEVELSEGSTDIVRRVAKEVGDEMLVIAHRDIIFNYYCFGLDHILRSFYVDPSFASEALRVIANREIEIAKTLLDEGAEVIIEGADVAGKTGPFMTPKHFKEFILPNLRSAVQAVKKKGAFLIKHEDGNYYPILDDIVDSGVDAIHAIEPLAGMNIGVVKKRCGDRVCLCGNIDCAYTLVNKSQADVIAEVAACIDDASMGGGHILTSSNTIHFGVKPENYLAMIRAARRYGRYPHISEG